MNVKEHIIELVSGHISYILQSNPYYDGSIVDCVNLILGGTDNCYRLPHTIDEIHNHSQISSNKFQLLLSKINEKESRRKKDGVFYTDHDVSNYIVANTFLHYIKPKTNNVLGFEKVLGFLQAINASYRNKLLNAQVYDPTCGTGEFLVSAMEIKLQLIKNKNQTSAETLARSISGNDIESLSTDISKLRLFFFILSAFEKLENPQAIAEIINANFTNNDAVNPKQSLYKQSNIIIGNPPYIEYRNYSNTTKHDYGNVFADVLHNSADSLTENGIMSFVIPLSYVSTQRMSKIRHYISEKIEKQIVLNFADRPDCLFTGVHQKLTILIAQQTASRKQVLSSSYNYWYTSEREKLFDGIIVHPLKYTFDEYWPKIGNIIEESLFNTLLCFNGIDILSLKGEMNHCAIYINQRGCFWMKAFTHDMMSNSYMRIPLPEEYISFVFCLLNSSLFFLLWIIISDGWHITNKELSFIKIPHIIQNNNEWQSLQIELENKLEQTKVFVGTKQVEFEYKHKECKNIIDKIDEKLASIYQLSEIQLEYIQKFALKYRIGDGA